MVGNAPDSNPAQTRNGASTVQDRAEQAAAFILGISLISLARSCLPNRSEHTASPEHATTPTRTIDNSTEIAKSKDLGKEEINRLREAGLNEIQSFQILAQRLDRPEARAAFLQLMDEAQRSNQHLSYLESLGPNITVAMPILLVGLEGYKARNPNDPSLPSYGIAASGVKALPGLIYSLQYKSPLEGSNQSSPVNLAWPFLIKLTETDEGLTAICKAIKDNSLPEEPRHTLRSVVYSGVGISQHPNPSRYRPLFDEGLATTIFPDLKIALSDNPNLWRDYILDWQKANKDPEVVGFYNDCLKIIEQAKSAQARASYLGIPFFDRFELDVRMKLLETRERGPDDSKPLAVLIYSGIENCNLRDHSKFVRSLLNSGYEVMYTEATTWQQGYAQLRRMTIERGADVSPKSAKLIVFGVEIDSDNIYFGASVSGPHENADPDETLNIQDLRTKSEIGGLRGCLEENGQVLVTNSNSGYASFDNRYGDRRNVYNYLSEVFPQADRIFVSKYSLSSVGECEVYSDMKISPTCTFSNRGRGLLKRGSF